MRKRLDKAVQRYIKEDSIRPVRGIFNALFVVGVLWALIFAFIWYVISSGDGGDRSSLLSTSRAIETREISPLERIWWGETITCLMEKGKILEEEAPRRIVEPRIIVVEGDFFECGSINTSSCTQNFDIFISQRMIGIKTNAYIFRHEFTHVLELAVKDRVSNNHSTDWWRNGKESICQYDQDIARGQLAAEADDGL